jgi:antitoxin (DNA-binding transcriptional repressor) of toxin-antitoxin stability system
MLRQLLDGVEHREEIVFTRRGREVTRLAPARNDCFEQGRILR